MPWSNKLEIAPIFWLNGFRRYPDRSKKVGTYPEITIELNVWLTVPTGIKEPFRWLAASQGLTGLSKAAIESPGVCPQIQAHVPLLSIAFDVNCGY